LSSFVWTLEGFALAQGYDETSKRLVGLVLPNEGKGPASLTDDWLLVKPDLAIAQRNADEPATPPGPSPKQPLQAADASGLEASGQGGNAGPTVPHRYFGSITIDPERYGRDFARIGQEVLQHLAAAAGTSLRVSVQIEATNDQGFSADTVRTVRENAGTLHFEANGFEGAS
jgi:hypothetical protein